MMRAALADKTVGSLPIVRRLAFVLYSQDRSIVEIFREAKVAPCMLSQWLSGISNPQLRTITNILDVLNMELVIQHKTRGKD